MATQLPTGEPLRATNGEAPPFTPNARPRTSLTPEEKSEIVRARRQHTLQVAGEGSDDIIMPSSGKEEVQHVAGMVLAKPNFIFKNVWFVRRFINSCLLNLSNHHGVDMSGLLPALARKNGFERLKDIMRYPMSASAPSSNSLSFQYDIIPFIGVLTREKVCQSTMISESSAVYALVYEYRRRFFEEGVIQCMNQVLARKSMASPGSDLARLRLSDPSICVVTRIQCALLAIVRLVYQLLNRIEEAQTTLAMVVETLSEQAATCARVSFATDEERFLNSILSIETKRLKGMLKGASITKDSIIGREYTCMGEPEEYPNGPNMAHLASTYDPPGELSEDGPRHDNDHFEISDISVLPTQKEITCRREPFMPSNGISEAPHFLPHGWQRQLDTHFRLYREDMMDPLRRGVLSFLSLLERSSKDSDEKMLNQRELRGLLDDSVHLNVYGNIQFDGMRLSKKKDGSIVLSFLQPPQLEGLSKDRRKDFWERSRSRLMTGGLVCIARRTDIVQHYDEEALSTPNFQMVLGVITTRNLNDLSAHSTHATIQVVLTDPSLYTLLISNNGLDNPEPWFLIEAPGAFFEAYRPILQALQRANPATMPFGKYLAPTEEDIAANESGKCVVDPPLYARAPNFVFDLSVLLSDNESYELNVSDETSVAGAIEVLQTHSALDDTQAQAFVESLSREIALISGPPGTGKTKIGVDLMRVLIQNKASMNCGPILCICYTNHALDQFLEHLLEVGIKDIVRVGSRSKSSLLDQYNLESLLRSRGKSIGAWQVIGDAMRSSDKITAKIIPLEDNLRNGVVTWEYVSTHLLNENPEQQQQLAAPVPDMETSPPPGAVFDATTTTLNEIDVGPDGDEDFIPVKGNPKPAKKLDTLAYWRTGQDLVEKEKINLVLKEIYEQSMNRYGLLSDNYELPSFHVIPDTDRTVEELDGDVWEMSIQERERLLESWKPEVIEMMMLDLVNLLKELEVANKKKDNAYNDIRREIMRKSSVIGMTTNGAAKFQSLIGAVAPKIIICEEAGEVLESHILAALSPSTQHVILIGDHLQLRPQIATFKLASDSHVGKNYKLDQSLFERLVTSTKHQLPLSHLTVQRRMRPEISSLIRGALYPNLVDGPNVQSYPDVCGMGSNVYFMDHSHPEDPKDQFGSQSFSNSFEVEMVEALAQYLIKNGFDKPGDIAILTPYLGQLSKLRDRLNTSFTLVIDERDQQQLDENDNEEKTALSAIGNMDWSVARARAASKSVSLQKHLTLRTIDNYQGEEAKIVIISLVRSKVLHDGTQSNKVGFLKSPNRTNVLLSRAKHGMYVLGNADLMEGQKTGIWPPIMQELYYYDRVGPGLPLVCKHHPEKRSIVKTAEMLSTVAPNAGCDLPCSFRLSCGHECPLKCHPNDPEHHFVICKEPCTKINPQCDQHLCTRTCGESCDDCLAVVDPAVLSCGHKPASYPCYQSESRTRLPCRVKVTRKLPNCSHSSQMECSVDLKTIVCSQVCEETLFCGDRCQNECGKCVSPDLTAKEGQNKSNGSTENGTAPPSEAKHGPCKIQCDQSMKCGHVCNKPCHKGSSCPPCQQSCARECSHGRCKLPCNVVCVLCTSPCDWKCPHKGHCSLPCGVPCDRLPCNERCHKTISCGHRCPGLCGETCVLPQYCVECKIVRVMETVVNPETGLTLGKANVNKDPIVGLTCSHVLTVSYLDQIMGLDQYYQIAGQRSATGLNKYTGLKSLPMHEGTLPGCPTCQQPIKNISRYGRRINYATLSRNMKNFQSYRFNNLSKAQVPLDYAARQLGELQTDFVNILQSSVAEPQEEPPKDERKLGKFLKSGDIFPHTDFRLEKNIYGIPEAHVKHWTRMVQSLILGLLALNSVHNKANRSPIRELVRVLTEKYEMKSSRANPLTPPPSPPSQDLAAFLSGLGLTFDGHAGPSHVDVILERTNAVLIATHYAQSVMEIAGASTGWYWFVDDLLTCALAHTEVCKEVARKGRHTRHLVYASMQTLNVLLMRARWYCRRPPLDNPEVASTRGQEVARLTTEFMEEFQRFTRECPEMMRVKFLKKAQEMGYKMVRAVEVAQTQESNVMGYDKEVQLYRVDRYQEDGVPDLWFRCQRGHTCLVFEERNIEKIQPLCPSCDDTSSD